MLQKVVSALAFLFLLTISGAAADKRVALVIGNSAYHRVPKLTNPSHDAAAIAYLLKDIGFEAVEVRSDVGLPEFRRALRLFGETAQDADIAVVYFAGHGIEMGGANYLIPIDARFETDIDVEDETVPLDRVLRALEPVRRLRLVILDACRDNPMGQGTKRLSLNRSLGRGLARVDPPTSDTLVAFAAKAGSVAADGEGPNSPFTQALLKHLAVSGLDVRLALGRVRDEVLMKTGRKQEPFVYGSLGGDTVTLAPTPVVGTEPNAHSSSDPETQARRDYELAERVGTAEGWDLFLKRHPSGFLADLARVQRVKLQTSKEVLLQPDADKRSQERANFDLFRRQKFQVTFKCAFR